MLCNTCSGIFRSPLLSRNDKNAHHESQESFEPAVSSHCAICKSLFRELAFNNSTIPNPSMPTLYRCWKRDVAGKDHLRSFYNLVVGFQGHGAYSTKYPTKHFILAPVEGELEHRAGD
jgi:hypothetical protein